MVYKIQIVNVTVSITLENLIQTFWALLDDGPKPFRTKCCSPVKNLSEDVQKYRTAWGKKSLYCGKIG